VLVAFDLDGVLIDSSQLVRDAYAHVGLRAPVDVLTCENVDWITPQLACAPEERAATRIKLHDGKDEYYVARVAQARKLPPWYAACRLARRGHICIILTAAPRGTITALRHYRHMWPFTCAREGVRTLVKMTLLENLQPVRRMIGSGLPAAYVDDQPERYPVPAGWRFVRYQDQSEEELMKEITG
jgi:hypothetical protein